MLYCMIIVELQAIFNLAILSKGLTHINSNIKKKIYFKLFNVSVCIQKAIPSIIKSLKLSLSIYNLHKLCILLLTS